MMWRSVVQLMFTGMVCASAVIHAEGQSSIPTVRVAWDHVASISKTTPTLQVVVNPQLMRGARMHDSSFAALKMLGADYVRFVPWLPYPKLAVAELYPPTSAKTFWDFSLMDPIVEDFMNATAGHPVVVNFSTIPAWMFKTSKPVTFPDDPKQVFWSYTQGLELRDPSMKEAADYYARLLSWYTQGGFNDENGKRWISGHHYKIAYWEVLNEIDLEHNWSPQAYTKFYDALTSAMRKVNPEIKFMALALAFPGREPETFEYFLNPLNHQPGFSLDFISYHFYASPTPEQTIANWQYSFFDQADGFLNSVRYIEAMRKRLSPSTKTDVDELGVILSGDPGESVQANDTRMLQSAAYWDLAAAMYAHLYIEFTRLGIDILGESQLVGYPSQFPSVTMVDYENGRPNARFWVLKLLKENFAPGDQLVETSLDDPNVDVQAFNTKLGKKILFVNKREYQQDVAMPADMLGASVLVVAPSTGDGPFTDRGLTQAVLHLEPFEVAVIDGH